MKKLILEGLLLVVLFAGTIFAFTKINWISIFKINKITQTTETKLGELMWDVFKNSEEEIHSPNVVKGIDSIVSTICKRNNIKKDFIKVHLLNKNEINAFALPNGHLVIYSGLILASENQEELAGVVCHEIAHIEMNHVMQKLIKEIGLSVLISMTTGGRNGESVGKATKMLTSSAFDRKLEKEADIKAVEYLSNAKIDPSDFANFLFKISKNEIDGGSYENWFSTHPDSKERAEYILEYSKKFKVYFESTISDSNWYKIQQKLLESNSNN